MSQSVDGSKVSNFKDSNFGIESVDFKPQRSFQIDHFNKHTVHGSMASGSSESFKIIAERFEKCRNWIQCAEYLHTSLTNKLLSITDRFSWLLQITCNWLTKLKQLLNSTLQSASCRFRFEISKLAPFQSHTGFFQFESFKRLIWRFESKKWNIGIWNYQIENFNLSAGYCLLRTPRTENIRNSLNSSA